MTTLFQHYPNSPNCPKCEYSYLILCNAHDTSSSFLDIFNNTRSARKARGAATDEEQDLLRAMLSFASAGFDSMIKQLVVDTLPAVIDNNVGAAESFKTFIEKRLYKGQELDHRLIADVLCNSQPRDRLIQVLVTELTSGSLQSVKAVFRAGSFFDIKSSRLCDDPDRLSNVFKSRNQMIHEMDIDFNQPNRNRRQRKKQQMIDNTNLIFSISNNFLVEVASKL